MDELIGTTLVSHDSEAPTTITNCVGIACYNKVVIYPGAAPKQLDALTSISSTCRQLFKVNMISTRINLT